MEQQTYKYLGKIGWVASFFFFLLYFNNVHAQPVCTAAFTYTLGTGPDCLDANFTNASTFNFGTPTYTWAFGDGNTSTAVNPTHSYTTPAVYSVTLTINTYDAETFLCSNTVVQSLTVCPTLTCLATFEVTSNSTLCSGFLFNPDMSSASSYSWSFGDGGTSGTENPSHTYTVNGNYAVTLTVTIGSTTCTSTQTVVVDCQCDPQFDYTQGNQADCRFFMFDAAQDGANLYSWNFGDPSSGSSNTYTSTVSGGATHSFTIDGTYTVTLHVTVGSATCTSTQTVTVHCNCDADFEFTHGSQGACPNYTFTATQSGANLYSWNFGDPSSGSNTYTSTTSGTATHSYTVDGTYTVTLVQTVGTVTCSSTHTISVTCACDADFEFDHGVQADCRIYSFDASQNGASLYSWNFGDPSSGSSNTYTSTASGGTATHSFTIDGTYTVTLTLTVGTVTCTSTQTVTVGCCPTATFAFTHGQQADCGFYTFSSQIHGGSGSAITYSWTFGDGGTSSSPNPTHIYTVSGTYSVTLTITSDPDCEYSTSQLVYVCPGDIVPCESCIGAFAPIPGEIYVISAWVHQASSETAITYNDPNITLKFSPSNSTTGLFKGKGLIIDGWQRIEEVFTVPVGSTEVFVRLTNGGTNDVFFDDIRVHPFNSNLKSFVYDPVSLRLMAELDENNYATFYEYDEEGALIRVKKETERGIKTIKEAGNNTRKKP